MKGGEFGSPPPPKKKKKKKNTNLQKQNLHLNQVLELIELFFTCYTERPGTRVAWRHFDVLILNLSEARES